MAERALTIQMNERLPIGFPSKFVILLKTNGLR